MACAKMHGLRDILVKEMSGPSGMSGALEASGMSEASRSSRSLLEALYPHGAHGVEDCNYRNSDVCKYSHPHVGDA